MTLTTRVGYCKLALNFICYGPELGIPLVQNTNSLQLVIGGAGWSTQRHFTDDELSRIAEAANLDVDSINPNPWNHIVPINVGLQYKYVGNTVHPYVGLDLMLIPNAVDTSQVDSEAALDMAVGARARAGVDFMVSEGFGFNLDLGVSYIGGSSLGMVDESLSKGGLAPQPSAGIVFRF